VSKGSRHVRFRIHSGFLGFITHLLVVILSRLRLKFFLLTLPTAYLYENGWMRSSKLDYPVDKSGKPLPWYPSNLIKFLESRLKQEHTIFEYGAGGSTIWFSNRVGRVFSVEHDQKWFMKLSKRLESRPNVQLVLHPLGASGPLLDLVFMPIKGNSTPYTSSILSLDFIPSIIVVDGVDRLNCITSAVQVANEQTIILVDNLEYDKEFSESLSYLKAKGFRCIEFWGLAPGAIRETCTGLFYRKENVLEI